MFFNVQSEWELEDWAREEIEKAQKMYKRGLCIDTEFITIALDVTARASESDTEWFTYIGEFAQKYCGRHERNLLISYAAYLTNRDNE